MNAAEVRSKMAEVIWGKLQNGEDVTLWCEPKPSSERAARYPWDAEPQRVTLRIFSGHDGEAYVGLHQESACVSARTLTDDDFGHLCMSSLGLQVFEVSLSEYLVHVMKCDEGLTCTQGEIEAEFSKAQDYYEEDKFKTFQHNAVFLDGVRVIEFDMLTWACGHAARFKRIHNSVTCGHQEDNYKRDGFLFMDTVVVQVAGEKQDRSNPIGALEVCRF